MADNINSIIDVSGFQADLKTVVDGIVTLETEIDKANGKAIDVTINLKGAESLNKLIELTEQQTQAAQSLNSVMAASVQVGNDVSNFAQKWGKTTLDNAEALAQQRLELGYVNDQIKTLNKNIVDGKGNMERNNALLGEYIKRQQELKVEIYETTSAIKSQIKESNAATTSMDAMSQRLGQLREQYRALTADERANADVGGVLQTQIRALDEQLKTLDASIGNNQRNVGNYSGALEKAGLNIDNIRAKLEGLNIANKESNVAFNLAMNALSTPSGGSGYVTTTSQLNMVKKGMQDVAAAGMKDSEVYRLLEVEGQRLTAVLKEVNASVKGVGESVKAQSEQIKIFGLSAEQAATKLGTMAFRMVAMQLLFAPIIAGIGFVAEKIMELIPGTDAYIKKQEDLIHSTDALKQSFDGLTQAIEDNSKILKDNITANIDNAEAQKAVMDNTVEGAKRQKDAIEAVGVQNRAVYEYEQKQLKASLEIKNQEMKALKDKESVLGKINLLILQSQGENKEDIISKINDSGLPADQKQQLKLSVEKSFKEGGINAVNKALEDARLKTVSGYQQIQQEIRTKQGEIDNLAIANNAKIERLKQEKTIELAKEIDKIKEQFRQANEKEDIASVDKIINDIRAKYQLLAKDIQRNRETYRLSVTTKEDAAYTDKVIQAYDKILATIKQISQQEQRNAAYEQTSAEYNNAAKTGVGLSQGAASISSFNAGFGVPNYDAMAQAIDAETKAKKDSLKEQFRQIASTITDSAQVIEAQKQLDSNLENVDKDSYRKRLQLAIEYFSRVAASINENAADLVSENSRKHFNTLTEISKKGTNPQSREIDKFLEEQKNLIAEANIQLQALEPKVSAARNAFGIASNNALGPMSPDSQEEANKQKIIAKKNLDDLLAQQAQYNNQIASADEAIRNKKIELLNEVKDKSIELAQETFSAINTIRDNSFAKEQQQLQIQQQQLELRSKQKIDAINAEAGFEIARANEVAKITAQTAAAENALQAKQNELALKKAIADKQAAESGVILNTALAITKTLPMLSNPVTAAIGAAEIALITAIGAAQYAAAASTPLPQFFTGGVTETPVFSAAEKGREIGVTPSGNVMMFDRPGAYASEIGTRIFNNDDTERLIRYAVNNMGVLERYEAPVKPGMTDKNILEKLDQLIEVNTFAAIHRPKMPVIKVEVRQNNLQLRK